MNPSGKTQAHVGVIAESDAISPFSLVGVKVEEAEDELHNTGITVARFHLPGLSGRTSQLLSRMHEFSELVLARVALFMDQGRFRTPVGQSAGISKVSRENYMRAPWTFPFKLAGTEKWKKTQLLITEPGWVPLVVKEWRKRRKRSCSLSCSAC